MTEMSMKGFKFQEGEVGDGVGWSGKGMDIAGSGG
jgi:hypothetical protein